MNENPAIKCLGSQINSEYFASFFSGDSIYGKVTLNPVETEVEGVV
jgi:hypothetical protein